jgi:DNA polymerase V
MILIAAEHPLSLRLPYFMALSPSASFPSSSADFSEGELDLNLHLVNRPEATFYVRISGRSLERADIHDNALAIVDRSITPRTGQIVAFVLHGELMVKRLRYVGGEVWFDSDNDDPRYELFMVPSDASFEIWGVVTNTIRDHQLRFFELAASKSK